MTSALSLAGLTQQVNAACQSEPVLLVYLFGSHARGTADEESDIDLAVLATPDLTPEERRELRFRLMRACADALGMPLERIDLVVLQDVPVLLRYNILRGGRLLFARDLALHHEFLLDTERRYADERPFLDREADLTIERILTRSA